MSAEDIIWEDPPEHAIATGQRSRYAALHAALREHPGRWAVLPGEKASVDSAKGTAMNIRNGRMRGFTKGQFDTRVDRTKVYVRYIGPAEGATPPDGAQETGADAGDDEVAVGASSTAPLIVRAWAGQNGFADIPDRGGFRQHIIHAFEEAQEAGDEAGVEG